MIMHQHIHEQQQGARYLLGGIDIDRQPETKESPVYIRIHQECNEGCDHTVSVSLDQAKQLVKALRLVAGIVGENA